MTATATLVKKNIYIEKLGVFDRRAFVFEQYTKRREREKRWSQHQRPDRQMNLPSGTGRMCPFRFGARPWLWANRSTRFEETRMASIWAIGRHRVRLWSSLAALSWVVCLALLLSSSIHKLLARQVDILHKTPHSYEHWLSINSIITLLRPETRV